MYRLQIKHCVYIAVIRNATFFSQVYTYWHECLFSNGKNTGRVEDGGFKKLWLQSRYKRIKIRIWDSTPVQDPYTSNCAWAQRNVYAITTTAILIFARCACRFYWMRWTGVAILYGYRSIIIMISLCIFNSLHACIALTSFLQNIGCESSGERSFNLNKQAVVRYPSTCQKAWQWKLGWMIS